MRVLASRSTNLRFVERPEFSSTPQVLASSIDEERHRGSAGGVVSALIRHLFETQSIGTCLDFSFEGAALYQPKLIHSFDEYSFCGSIYHAMDSVGFLRAHLQEIRGPIFVTCLPCEVKASRKLLGDAGIDSIILSLICSNQLTRDATYHLLDMNGIDRNSIERFRYRGGGWPSGVQVTSKGKEYFFNNNASEWLHIFHAHVYSLDKCYGCADTFGMSADITVGDPWLPRYIEGEERGASLIIAHTDVGRIVIDKALASDSVRVLEVLSDAEAIESQRFTLNKKRFFRQHRPLITRVRGIIQKPFYMRMLRNKLLLRIHYRVFTRMIYRLARRTSDGEYHERT